MSMRPVYVKFAESHHRILRQKARDEGCSISDLVRRATIGLFHLPTGGDEIATDGDASGGIASESTPTPEEATA